MLIIGCAVKFYPRRDLPPTYSKTRGNGGEDRAVNALVERRWGAIDRPDRATRKDIDMTVRSLAIILAFLFAGALPATADETFIAEQKPTEYLAKDRLIGANVHDGSGKVIGDIEDLIVDNDNRITGVIIGVGGLLGIGEKKVGVAIASLSIESTDGKMNVIMPAATKDALAAAPAFTRINPPKGWLQRAVEKGEELRDKGKDAYEAAREQAGPALEKAKAAAERAIEKAKEAAQPSEAPKN